MDSVTKYVGDRNPSITDTITVDGSAFNLSGSTVKFQMREVSTDVLTVDAAATVVSAVAGTVRYDWAAADVDTAGEYRAWWLVTTSGLTQATPEFTVLLVPHSEPTGYGTTDYASLQDVKTVLGIGDQDDDIAIMLAVTAASRAIDHHCRRQFGVATATAQRLFDAPAPWKLDNMGNGLIPITDIQTTTGLVVESASGPGESFTTTLVRDTDYELWPLNAAADGRPWTHLRVWGYPQGGTRYRVTATYGWTTVPDAVAQACLVQAVRFFKRKDSPFGVAGSPEFGGEMRLLAKVDPDVAVLLAPYRRWWEAV